MRTASTPISRGSDEPKPVSTFGFVHGKWSLDNSRGDEHCGVNNELAVLRELEIEMGQGYLLGRPLPFEEAGRPARLRPARRRPTKRLPLQEPAEP